MVGNTIIHILFIFFLFFSFSLSIISYVPMIVAKYFTCVILLNPRCKLMRYELSDLCFRNEATEA